MMRERETFEGQGDDARGTCHEFETALIVRTIRHVNSRRLMLPRGGFDEGNILRVQNALFPELEIQTSTIMRSTNVFISHDVTDHSTIAAAQRDQDHF